MTDAQSQEQEQPAVEYRDQQGRVWSASEVAQLRVVSPSVDGPNLCLVIRFEREGEERFARWIGGEEWRLLHSLQRLFAESEGPTQTTARDDPASRPVASPEMVRQWCDLVKEMGPDELGALEDRTSAEWEPASLGELRGAIRHRWRQLEG